MRSWIQSLKFSAGLLPSGSRLEHLPTDSEDRQLWLKSIGSQRVEFAFIEILDSAGNVTLRTEDITSNQWIAVDGATSMAALYAVLHAARRMKLHLGDQITIRYRHTHALGVPVAFSKLSLRDKKGALAFKALIEAAGFKNASFEMDAIYTKNFRGTDLGKHRLTIPSTVRWLKGDFALKFSWQKASYDSPSFAEELDNNADFQPTLKLRQ